MRRFVGSSLYLLAAMFEFTAAVLWLLYNIVTWTPPAEDVPPPFISNTVDDPWERWAKEDDGEI